MSLESSCFSPAPCSPCIPRPHCQFLWVQPSRIFLKGSLSRGLTCSAVPGALFWASKALPQCSLGSKSGVWTWVPLELQERALRLRVKIIRNGDGDEGLGLGLGFYVSCGEDLSKQDGKVPPQGSDLPGFEGLRSCHAGCGEMGGAGAASTQECLCASPGPAPMAKEVRTPTMRRSCISTVSCHSVPA